jgi:hypothetical protein
MTTVCRVLPSRRLISRVASYPSISGIPQSIQDDVVMTQRECLQPQPCAIDDFRAIVEHAELRGNDGSVRVIILNDQDSHVLAQLALSILGRVISGYLGSWGMCASGGHRQGPGGLSSLLEPHREMKI